MVDNLKLVLYFTGSRFNGRLDGCLSTDDVVQAGCLGLMTAIEQFDITKKTNLSTYASYGIKQSANCEFFEKCCTMRGPRWLLQQIQQIDKNYQDVDWSDPAALQQRFNMTKETAVAACKWHYPCLISLSTPWKRDDKLVNIADVVADFNAISPEKAVIRKGLTEDLTNFLSENLSKRNQKILFGRYANHKTLEELGEELHLTHERVRQLEQHGTQMIKKFIERY